MKKIILGVMVAVMATTAMAARYSPERTIDIENVRQSVIDTSVKGQWLPYWNQVAIKQLELMREYPHMDLSMALADAEAFVIGTGYMEYFQWDDAFYCNFFKAVQGNGQDVRYDYCTAVKGHIETNDWHKVTDKKFDPDQDTNFGGLLWSNEGRI